MGYKDLLHDSRQQFTKDSISFLLETLIKDALIYPDGFRSIIEDDKDNVVRMNPEDLKNYIKEHKIVTKNNFINSTIPISIMDIDRKYMLELSGFDSLHELAGAMSNNPAKMDELRAKIVGGIISSDRTYYSINSNELFPNTTDLRMDGDIAYRLVVNADSLHVYNVLNRIFNDFTKKSVPFNIKVKNITTDNNRGYTNPIEIYTTEALLDKTCDVLTETLSSIQEEVKSPNLLLGTDINGLFCMCGVYSSSGKYESKLDKVIDATIASIDSVAGLYGTDRNWRNRIGYLLSSYNIDSIVEGAYEYLKGKGFNLDHIFDTSMVQKEEKKELEAFNMKPISYPVGDPFFSDLTDEDLDLAVKMVNDEQVEEIKVEDTEYKEPTDIQVKPVIEPVEETVTANDEEAPEVSAVYTDLSDTQLIGNLVESIEKAKKLLSDENSQERVVEQTSANTTETIKSNAPIMPEDDVDPKNFLITEEDDEPELNLGYNYGIEKGNTGEIKIEPLLSDKEAYSLSSGIMEAGQQEDVLGEYNGVIDYNDAITNICISQSGDTIRLIDYFKREDLKNSIPFDKYVIDMDGNQYPSRVFIKEKVIPLLKSNTPERIHTLGDIRDNYISSIEDKEELIEDSAKSTKKKGFFFKRFGKKDK